MCQDFLQIVKSAFIFKSNIVEQAKGIAFLYPINLRRYCKREFSSPGKIFP